MNQISEPPTSYGGPWTLEKLDILESYLDAYTTALKKQPFKLMYIDAFAGTGYVEPQDKDAKILIVDRQQELSESIIGRLIN